MQVLKFNVLKAVEGWASQSDDRMRLAVVSIWIALALLVVGFTVVLGWLLLPADYSLF